MPKHIVIAGPPRTGTRFVTNALNKHPEVCIQGEVPPSVLDNAIEFVTKTDAEFRSANYEKWNKTWLKTRTALFEDMLAATQKYPDKTNTDRKKVAYTGFKLPAAVARLKELEAVYDDVRFVLCVREFVPFHLSCVSRWPKRTIKETSRSYLEALGHIRDVIDRTDKGFVFPLEHLKTHGAVLLKELGAFLDLPKVDSWVKLIDPSQKANQAERFTDKKRTELTEKERAFVENTTQMKILYDSIVNTRTYTQAA
ncbi:sulfotransferase [Mycoplana sp. MJR14]|uniref:sulfotransferase n=1 Tax=Mycoplana sp. MJR14 TaxID=3032583 RepID=UPI0023D9A541|nr:sulfotransferase [Mycoplana sp. MJR14]MDF1632195.1 sulfotransferase [Mycoplana sp. MJR14]